MSIDYRSNSDELQMSASVEHSDRELLRAQAIFKEAPEEHKELIRAVLKEERDVVNHARRKEIHQRIYEHVKRVIK